MAAIAIFLLLPFLWIGRQALRVGPQIFYLSALAEDEDEDEDEEEDEDEDEDEDDEDKEESKPKTETVTTYVKLPDQIIKQNIVTTIYDSDGDGIFDPEDPHPDIHEMLIVKDENLNGIDDDYEKL